MMNSSNGPPAAPAMVFDFLPWSSLPSTPSTSFDNQQNQRKDAEDEDDVKPPARNAPASVEDDCLLDLAMECGFLDQPLPFGVAGNKPDAKYENDHDEPLRIAKNVLNELDDSRQWASLNAEWYDFGLLEPAPIDQNKHSPNVARCAEYTPDRSNRAISSTSVLSGDRDSPYPTHHGGGGAFGASERDPQQFASSMDNQRFQSFNSKVHQQQCQATALSMPAPFSWPHPYQSRTTDARAHARTHGHVEVSPQLNPLMQQQSHQHQYQQQNAYPNPHQRHQGQRSVHHGPSYMLQRSELDTNITSSSVASSPISAPTETTVPDASVEDEDTKEKSRFRSYQSEQWSERFQELLAFRSEHTHCNVPHAYDRNPALARWVKRQRYQQKLWAAGKPSTMTPERQADLDRVGFLWDSHGAAWQERWTELLAFRRQYGHCNVPSEYATNPKLATWVKCQRRQYKILQSNSKTTSSGTPSNMTQERIEQLERLGFEWELRVCRKSKKAKKEGADTR